MRLVTLSVFILALTFGVFGDAGVASAEKRVALVIGNGQYGRNIGSLTNPPNDAKLVAQTLRGLDFEVFEAIDGTQIGMKKAISRFGKTLDTAGKDGVGLFYYAGHGVQVNGANYLIPVDAEIETEGDVDLYAVNANSVLKMMEFSGARLSFVILDACRNNPFARSFRSASRGLAKLEAPQGSLVAYATSPGNVAADGKGENSPYTKALVRGMKSGKPVELMFRQVRNDVMQETKKKQTPWESSSLTGADFYFKGGSVIAAAPVSPMQQGQSPPATGLSPEMMFWQSIQGSKDADDYQAYLEQYPKGSFAALAKLRVRKLKKTQLASLPKQNSGTLQAPKTASDNLIRDVLADAISVTHAIRESRTNPARAFNRGLYLSNVGDLQKTFGDLEGARRTMKAAIQTANALTDSYGWKDSILGNVAPLQAATGDVAGALRTANGLPVDHRSSALANIAIAQFENGDTQGARRTLGNALDIANASKDDKERARLHYMIITAQAKIDGPEAGLRIANHITDSYWYASSLKLIAYHHAEEGDIDGALGILSRVEEEHRPGTLSRIAELQAKAGVIEGARRNMTAAIRFARKYPDEYYKGAFVLLEIAQNQARMGDKAGARKTAEEALRIINTLEKIKRSNLLPTYAAVQILVGDEKGAFATADSLSDNKNTAFWHISSAQAETGVVEEGRRTVNRITDTLYKSIALTAIAQHLIKKRKEELQALKGN